MEDLLMLGHVTGCQSVRNFNDENLILFNYVKIVFL
jgi:hypothetical protein